MAILAVLDDGGGGGEAGTTPTTTTKLLVFLQIIFLWCTVYTVAGNTKDRRLRCMSWLYLRLTLYIILHYVATQINLYINKI
jgi:hypothetical protein